MEPEKNSGNAGNTVSSSCQSDGSAQEAIRARSLLPLPEEIANLAESETACKYCGVSYLLLNRMEQMQNLFSKLASELEERKDFCASRREKLESQLADAKAKAALLEQQITQTKANLVTLATRNKKAITTANQNMTLVSEVWVKLKAQVRDFSSTWFAEQCCSFWNSAKEYYESKIANQQKQHLADLAQKDIYYQEEVLRLKEQHEEEMSHAKKNLAKVQETLTLMTEQHDAVNSERVILENHLRQKKEELQQCRTQHDAKVNELTENINTLSMVVADLSAKNESLQAKEKFASDELGILKIKFEALTAAEANSKTTQKKSEHELQEQIKNTAKELNDLQHELERTIAAHQTRLRQLQCEFQERIQITTNSCTALKRQLETSNSEVERLSKDLNSKATNEIESEQNLRAEFDKLWEAREKETSAAAEMLKEQLFEASKKFEEAQDNFKEQLAAVNQDYKCAQCRLEESKEANKRLQNEVDRLQLEVQKTKGDLHNDINKLRETVRRECAERLALVSQIQEMQISRSFEPKEEKKEEFSVSSSVEAATEFSMEPEENFSTSLAQAASSFEAKLNSATQSKKQRMKQRQRRKNSFL